MENTEEISAELLNIPGKTTTNQQKTGENIKKIIENESKSCSFGVNPAELAKQSAIRRTFPEKPG